MWSYYGRKTKVVKHYPKPERNTIIEPFAGTATYALYGDNWKKRVILVEKYDVIVGIWKYLQAATPEQILSLPSLKGGQSVDEFPELCKEERHLIGFSINGGSSSPKKTVSVSGNFGTGWDLTRERIAKDLHKIKHWEIVHGDYRCLANIDATWYIDPPYQFGGIYYRHNNSKIDFEGLAEWCRERKGQVIVCENTKATWLPFTALAKQRGNMHVTTEAIWTKGCSTTQSYLF